MTRILVCVKFIQGELNPFDAAALECALELSDSAARAGREPIRVWILGMGPALWEEPMKRLTRLGKPETFKAILLSDPAFAGSDTLATSRILAAAVRKIEAENGTMDWIFCGRQTIDGDTAQVGPELAQMLNRPFLTNVMACPDIFATEQGTPADGSFRVSTRLGEERIKTPALLTMERIRDLRFPSLRSRPGAVDFLNRSALGLSPSECGLAGSGTRVLETFRAERGRRDCRWITSEELIPLLDELRNRPKMGMEIPQSPKRLPCLHIVGPETEAMARSIADEVIFVKKGSPEEIVQEIRDADAVLWNADFWGRKTAPQVAAMLQAGLCADCTALETDGETLFLYRPARSGDILAKIECLTRPQMATVRTVGECADFIIAGGRGISGYWEHLRIFAEKIGAEPAASRALVDSDHVPYEFQIGLTGRRVSPKIYLAVGISGAVQHTCAMDTSDFIIAVNPDRDARVFEYADYGIHGDFAELMKLVNI